MTKEQNFKNVIEFLKINGHGFYAPTQTTEDMYNYFKEKKINFTYEKLDSGFYKFSLIK
jgi:hypothetical protein